MYPMNYRLKFPYLIAKVLSTKTILRSKLVAAYKSKSSKCELEVVRENYILKLSQMLDKLWRCHRDLIWLSTYKHFGLEVLELRYGAIRTRLASISDRISSIPESSDKMMDVDDANECVGSLYQAPSCIQEGKKEDSDSDSLDYQLDSEPLTDVIPELDEELLEPYSKSGSELILDFNRSYTPSRMSWTT